MRALAAAGRTAEALRTGHDYRRRLAEEAGLDPSSALDELERAIASGAISVASPVCATATPVRPAATPAQPATRLIGRDAQVATLQRLLGTERLVTLVGPGGVGKTRVATASTSRPSETCYRVTVSVSRLDCLATAP